MILTHLKPICAKVIDEIKRTGNNIYCHSLVVSYLKPEQDHNICMIELRLYTGLSVDEYFFDIANIIQKLY